MKKEVWKQVSGYEGIYEISDKGLVRSLDRISLNGKNIKGKFLKPELSRAGYYYVRLYKDGYVKALKTHRLVAKTFIPNENDKSEVNHIDGNKTNNAVVNLEWVSRSENIKHAYEKGLMSVRGERNPSSKLLFSLFSSSLSCFAFNSSIVHNTENLSHMRRRSV